MSPALPPMLPTLLKQARGDLRPVQRVLAALPPDARGGPARGTILHLPECTAELARWAIERGTPVDALDDDGATALLVVARTPRSQMSVEDLLGLGAIPFDGHHVLAREWRGSECTSSRGVVSVKRR
ncbi:MAG: hypothetical protein KC621_07300, partial [Myxococcales bacterium]|nr:hypothetical protein [Myxococcales bacterium]